MALLRPRTRAVWLRLHRWLGLGLGAAFVMFGLTGSLLVFYTGIDEAIEPALTVPGPELQVRSWQAVLEALQRDHPKRDRGWRIELEPGGLGLVTARYMKPEETADAFYKPLLVTVNPATGQVLANRFWGDFAATWVYDLHYMLLAGETGHTLVGLLGLLMLVSLVGGLVLWWPRPGHWRDALRLKLLGSRQRRHYDLHKLAGVGGGVVLVVLAATGAALALPSWVEPPLARISPPLPMLSPKATLQPGVPTLTLDQVLAHARAHWPESTPRWVDTPPTNGAIYRIRTWLPGGPSERFPRSYLWIHAQTGEVLAERDARQQSASDAVLAWLHPLHNGEAFDMPGRVLACVAGLLPLLLMVTGVQRWVDRRRADRERIKRMRRSNGPTSSLSSAQPDHEH
jgi:uncharacterized iron-regulated membrane protein